MKRSATLAATGLGCLVGLVLSAPVQAAGCVWGQPGYRACVDDLLAKRRTLEEPVAKPKTTETFKTAPARNRAPALTPLGGASAQPQPIPTMPQGADRTLDNQRMMDDSFARMKRDAARPAIMPQNRDLFPMPGRICPSQGC